MSPQDRELLDAFETLSLPFERWNQRTHVSIAFAYLRCYGFDGALDRMRRGVKAYNAHNGVEESPTSGFNETTTVAFLRLIDCAMQTYGDVFPTTDAEQFCDAHPQLTGLPQGGINVDLQDVRVGFL